MQPDAFHAPITEIIRQRFSCRKYSQKPIEAAKQRDLQEFMESLPPGPFGSQPRFRLVAATEAERASLRSLGTYGFIRGATGFIIGAMTPSEKNLEDYGYLMETIILYATSLELGTCWLGGTFTKSSFAQKMGLKNAETIPAATALGEFLSPEQARHGLVSRMAGAERRLGWESLFFEGQFDNPLDQSAAREYATPLEMVRIAPSASNKQPWRVVKDKAGWHFYLQRTPGYRADPLKVFLGLCDLQRLDLGIALCHFELTTKELGLEGQWTIQSGNESEQAEYIASWVSA